MIYKFNISKLIKNFYFIRVYEIINPKKKLNKYIKYSKKLFKDQIKSD